MKIDEVAGRLVEAIEHGDLNFRLKRDLHLPDPSSMEREAMVLRMPYTEKFF